MIASPPRKSLFFISILSLLCLGTSLKLKPELSLRKIKTIVLDAGHGGIDNGASGAFSKEKNVSLQITLALGKALEERLPDVKIVYTRKTDVLIGLYDRIGLANKVKADIFISIHCNSMPLKTRNRGSVRGAEILLSGSGRLGEQDVAIRENASILLEKDYKTTYDGYDPKDPASFILLTLMKNAYRKQGINLATAIQEQYRKVGRIDKGVREQSLAVLARAGMPAVLSEIGYISSPEEENYMNSVSGRKELVNCLLEGILAYKLNADQYGSEQ